MSTTVTICDKDLGQSEGDNRELLLPSESLTVRELIRERVFQEVKDRNAGANLKARMLVTPTGEEALLNQDSQAKLRKGIDWKKQFETACEAFEANRILVVVDDHQAESLEQTVTVTSRTVVTFMRLQMLVGG